MGLIKTPKVEEVTHVIITHILTGGGYLSVNMNTDFDSLVDMLRDEILPNVLLKLTDDNEIQHFMKVTDIYMNAEKTEIYFCARTNSYYLEFMLNSDGGFSKPTKNEMGVN